MTAKPSDEDFEEFVRASWGRLSRAAYALTGNRNDAEDLLQAVLVGTYARWSTVGRSDPVAYVRRALVNRYVDGWRRQRRVRLDPTDAPPDTPVAGGLDEVEARADLQRVLSGLTERERAMVVLRYYLDCSERDVAAELGCSVGTVKGTCSRALARLRISRAHLEGTAS